VGVSLEGANWDCAGDIVGVSLESTRWDCAGDGRGGRGHERGRSAERRAQAERVESGKGVAACLFRGIVVRGRRGDADAGWLTRISVFAQQTKGMEGEVKR
jgi:hypothetical protein